MDSEAQWRGRIGKAGRRALDVYQTGPRSRDVEVNLREYLDEYVSALAREIAIADASGEPGLVVHAAAVKGAARLSDGLSALHRQVLATGKREDRVILLADGLRALVRRVDVALDRARALCVEQQSAPNLIVEPRAVTSARSPAQPEHGSPPCWVGLKRKCRQILTAIHNTTPTAKEIAKRMRFRKSERQPEKLLKDDLAQLKECGVLGHRRASGYWLIRWPSGTPDDVKRGFEGHGRNEVGPNSA